MFEDGDTTGGLVITLYMICVKPASVISDNHYAWMGMGYRYALTNINPDTLPHGEGWGLDWD